MLRHKIIAAAMLFTPMAAVAASTCPASLHIERPTFAQIEYSGVHVMTGACAGRISMAYARGGRLFVGVKEHYTHRLVAFALPLAGRQFFGVGRVVKLKSAPHGGIAVIPMWGGRHRPITHAPAHDTIGARVRVSELFNR